MKRMYVILGILFLLGVGVISALAQKLNEITEVEQVDKRLQLHDQIHQRMRDKIIYGLGPDEDLFKDMDQLFDDAFTDSFGTKIPKGSFEMEWSETTTGRLITITPQSPEQKLDISVKDEILTVKGQSETKTQNGSSSSSFSNSISVPRDCDGSKVKINQKDGKLLVEFPYRNKKDTRMPLPPSKEDIEI